MKYSDDQAMQPVAGSAAKAKMQKNGGASHYPYIIVGAGPAGVICAETLAKNLRQIKGGPKGDIAKVKGQILLIGGEAEPPYSRMALPYYLINRIDETGTYLRKKEDALDAQGIEYQQGLVDKIMPDQKTIRLSDGRVISYDKLCLATGSKPVRPPIDGLDLPNIHHCWTLEDGRKIAAKAKPGSNVVLMGAGFIGCIILEALAGRKVNLYVVEMGDRMVPRMLDELCGGLVQKWCQQKGVHVHVSTKIEKVSKLGKDQLQIDLSNGQKIEADLLVVAAGVKPELSYLDGTNLEMATGIRVNAHMQTSNPDIYAAGDVAEAIDFSTGEWSVHAIQPIAADHGRIAALNMLGKKVTQKAMMGMNVLDTLGLISTSFGKWDGVENGEFASRVDRDKFRYTRLEFDGDRLIGGQTLGRTNHVGVIRGLIQNQIPLGKWKDKLLQDPNLIMDAYVDLTSVK